MSVEDFVRMKLEELSPKHQEITSLVITMYLAGVEDMGVSEEEDVYALARAIWEQHLRSTTWPKTPSP